MRRLKRRRRRRRRRRGRERARGRGCCCCRSPSPPSPFPRFGQAETRSHAAHDARRKGRTRRDTFSPRRPRTPPPAARRDGRRVGRAHDSVPRRPVGGRRGGQRPDVAPALQPLKEEETHHSALPLLLSLLQPLLIRILLLGAAAVTINCRPPVRSGGRVSASGRPPSATQHLLLWFFVREGGLLPVGRRRGRCPYKACPKNLSPLQTLESAVQAGWE